MSRRRTYVAVAVALLGLVACASSTSYEDRRGEFTVSMPHRWENTTEEAMEEWASLGDPRFELVFAATRFKVQDGDRSQRAAAVGQFSVRRGSPKALSPGASDQGWLTSWASQWLESQPSGFSATPPRAFRRGEVVAVEVEAVIGDSHELRRFYRLAEDKGLEAVCVMPVESWVREDCVEMLGGLKVGG